MAFGIGGPLMNVRPCMGGWCPLRDKCEHCISPDNRHRPSERLCEIGAEREMFFLRMREECVQRDRTSAASTPLMT